MDSNIYYKSYLFDTKIVFIDVETINEMDVVPHLIIENGVTDSLILLNYITNRSIETWGEKRILKIGFNVPKECNISQIEHIISVSQEDVIELHPDFKGVLEIVIKYSTKGDDWLKLPPPPPVSAECAVRNIARHFVTANKMVEPTHQSLLTGAGSKQLF